MKATRQEAIQAQERYFYNGKPCKHGHISKRMTVNGSCYECVKQRSKQYQMYNMYNMYPLKQKYTYY